VSELVKQPSSAMCFVCGRENPVGLHVHFSVDEKNRVHTEFTPRVEHQGSPGIMHGGLIATLFDEAIGRAAIAHNFWSVTAELTVRYTKPVPIGEPLRLMSHVVEMKARVLKGRAAIHSVRDNILLAEAEGVFVRISEERRREMEANGLLDWRVA